MFLVPFLLLALMPQLTWSQSTESQALILQVGEKKVLSSREGLVLPENKIIKIRDLGDGYEILAVKAGAVQMRLGKSHYRVSVLQHKQFETHRLLKSLLTRKLGLETKIEDGQVQLSGRLLSAQDWMDIAEACVKQGCDYQAKFQIHPELRGATQTTISRHFEKLGFNSFRLRWEPQAQILIPANSNGIRTLEEVARPFGLQVVKEEGALELAPSIRVQIMILEIRKQETLKYGIKWPTSYSAQLLPKVQNVDSLMLSAQFLESNGVGRILASPNILCRSGKDSEFLAGGEIPIKILSERTADVIWKKYGILLRLKPQADFSGRMSLGIETEVSKIDTAHTVDGIPGFETNRVQSHFDLTEPRTIALSGLLRLEEGEAREGLPLLSRVPVLGSLFSSREFQKQQTELVILVRPEMVSLGNDGAAL